MLSIIKISVESRALLCCYDLEKVERTKEFILILCIVITSHIESMRHKLLRVDERSLGHRCN